MTDLLGFGVLLAVLGILVLVVLSIAVRDEPDPDGLRSRALYLTSVCFVALFTTLFGLYAAIAALVGLALDDDGQEDFAAPVELAASADRPVLFAQSDFDERDSDDRHVSDAVGAGLVAVAGGAVLWFHARKLRDLVREHDVAPGPVRRTWRAYLHVVCFTAILTCAVAGAVGAYGLFEAAAPGVTGVESRKDGAAQALSAGLLGVGAFMLFHFHWRRTDRRAGPAFEQGVVVPASPDSDWDVSIATNMEPAEPPARPRRTRPLRATPQPPDDPRGPAQE
jgi:hypothetical protein